MSLVTRPTSTQPTSGRYCNAKQPRGHGCCGLPDGHAEKHRDWRESDGCPFEWGELSAEQYEMRGSWPVSS